MTTKGNYRIVFMDDRTDLIEHVDATVIADGILHLFKDRPFGGGREHVASFPLTNVRMYRFEEL